MKNKIFYFLFIFLFIFTSVVPVHAESDTTPPNIDNITFSKTEVKPGDILTITIEASDTESGFDENTYCSIMLYNGSRYINSIRPKYNLSTGNFELNYQIPSDMQSGNWYVCYAYLYDKAGNFKEIYNHDTTKYNFTVIDGTSDVTPPTLNNIIFTKTEVKQGDNLLITVEASDTESGFDENTNCIIQLYNGSRFINALMPKYNSSTGSFELNYQIPSDMQSGNWYVCSVDLYDKAGNYKHLNNSDSTKYNFNVKSIFQGTENISLLVGSNFNPLQGVEAISELEGNISSKISYEGSIDTSKDGLYLIKYTVIGIGGVYVDYRWISIVSNLAYDGNGQPTGTYFNKDISLSLSNLVNLNSISLTKDGNSYVLSDNSTISEEGKYVLSFKNTVNQVNSMERLLKVSSTVLSESSTNIQPSSFEFTIDKTSPKILEYYPQIIDEGTQINADKFVKASDNNKLSYEYLTEPQWTKIGEQNVQILVKDLAGNQVTQGVKLTVIDKCDIDRDGKVSIMDLASVAQNYNVKSTQANWNPRFDFNKDNIVDIFDLVTCSRRLEVN